MKKSLLFVVAWGASSIAMAKDLYRAPSAGDSGAYYVLRSEKLDGGQVKVLTSRIGKGSEYTDFTELKINCQSREYLVLAGGSEDGAKEKPSKALKDWSKDSKWTSLVSGSSKSDLVGHVCGKRK